MALQDLRAYYDSVEKEDFNSLLKQRCLVTEKIQASSLHVRREDNELKFYKSGNKQALNKIDRTIISYYERGIGHFGALLKEKVDEMPADWKFGFDYMVTEKTVDIEYDMLPKNNLILTHIQVLNEDRTQIKKVIRDPRILEKWADILEVQSPEVIYEGILSDYQKEKLIKILSLQGEQARMTFEDFTFSYHAFKIFNESTHKSMLNNDIHKDIDSLVVSFLEGKTLKNFKLQNPIKEVKEREERKSSDAYQITVVKLVEYFKDFNFSEIQIEGKEVDERYIELLSAGFNSFLKDNGSSFIGMDFNSASFATSEEFDLNPKMITNQETIRLVNESREVAELFKITLSTFRKKRQKESDVLGADSLGELNEIVDKIETIIYENVESGENGVMDFKTFKINDTLKGQINPINEGLNLKHKEKGSKEVNMFVGRFQPFTLGHVKVVEHLHKQNGLPTVIFLVKAKTKKKEDSFKRPFDETMQVNMIKQVMREYPIETVYVIDTGAIDKMFNAMRPKYEPVLWGTGSDRMKTYGYQVNNPKYREELGVDEDFRLEEIPRTDDNISATKVRNALLDGDERTFKSMTPKSMHKMYELLKQTMEESVEMQEQVLTFVEFKK
jgi:cytidyltransferase-like protein